MIEQLTIRNFQSHKKSILEFDPGVNVIVGPTDSGKTAIIRALRWVVWNRPQGVSFRSNWGGSTWVKVRTNHQGTVTRLRNNTENGYILFAEDKVKSHFKALKTDVPDQIIRTLDVGEINLQQQLDSPFLLSQTSGEVAKHFNDIAHLDQIDRGISNVKRNIREVQAKISGYNDNIERLQEDLKQFDHLAELEIEIEVLEQMEKDKTDLSNSIPKLRGLVERIEKVDHKIQIYSEVTKAERLVNSIITKFGKRKDIREETEALRTLIEDIEDVNKEIAEQEEILKAERSINNILALIDKREEVSNSQNQLMNLVKKIFDNEAELGMAEDDYDRLHKEFEKHFPDICPLCNQKVKKYGTTKSRV